MPSLNGNEETGDSLNIVQVKQIEFPFRFHRSSSSVGQYMEGDVRIVSQEEARVTCNHCIPTWSSDAWLNGYALFIAQPTEETVQLRQCQCPCR